MYSVERQTLDPEDRGQPGVLIAVWNKVRLSSHIVVAPSWEQNQFSINVS